MKFLTTLLVTLTMSLAAHTAFAAPAPLGLELGKANVSEMKKKYTANYLGVNKYSQGEMYSLPASQINVSGVTKATAVFNKKQNLVAILLTMDKHRFDSIHNSLKSKYRVQSKNIPFVGNKKVVYKSGSTEVELSAPHMSFDMSLEYYQDEFINAYKRILQQEKQKEKQKEVSNL